jgi:hypothetical protein
MQIFRKIGISPGFSWTSMGPAGVEPIPVPTPPTVGLPAIWPMLGTKSRTDAPEAGQTGLRGRERSPGAACSLRARVSNRDTTLEPYVTLERCGGYRSHPRWHVPNRRPFENCGLRASAEQQRIYVKISLDSAGPFGHNEYWHEFPRRYRISRTFDDARS